MTLPIGYGARYANMGSSGSGGPTLTGQAAPFVWSGILNGNSVAIGTNGGYVTCYLDCPVSVTITKAIVGAINTTGNMEVAIFNAAGTTKLATTGTIAGVVSGNPRTVALTAATTLSPGTYVGVFAIANTSSVAPLATPKFVASATVVGTFPIPANISAHLPVVGTAFSGTSIPYLGFI